jgi:hypothetical protein
MLMNFDGVQCEMARPKTSCHRHQTRNCAFDVGSSVKGPVGIGRTLVMYVEDATCGFEYYPPLSLLTPKPHQETTHTTLSLVECEIVDRFLDYRIGNA